MGNGLRLISLTQTHQLLISCNLLIQRQAQTANPATRGKGNELGNELGQEQGQRAWRRSCLFDATAAADDDVVVAVLLPH